VRGGGLVRASSRRIPQNPGAGLLFPENYNCGWRGLREYRRTTCDMIGVCVWGFRSRRAPFDEPERPWQNKAESSSCPDARLETAMACALAPTVRSGQEQTQRLPLAETSSSKTDAARLL